MVRITKSPFTSLSLGVKIKDDYSLPRIPAWTKINCKSQIIRSYMVSDCKNKSHWLLFLHLGSVSRQLLLLPFCHHGLRKLQQEMSQNRPSLAVIFPDEKKGEKNTDLVTDSLSFCVCVLDYLQACGFPGAGPHTPFFNAWATLLCLPENCPTNIMTLFSDKGGYFSKSTEPACDFIWPTWTLVNYTIKQSYWSK